MFSSSRQNPDAVGLATQLSVTITCWLHYFCLHQVLLTHHHRPFFGHVKLCTLSKKSFIAHSFPQAEERYLCGWKDSHDSRIAGAHRGSVADPASELVPLWRKMEQQLHVNPVGPSLIPLRCISVYS